MINKKRINFNMKMINLNVEIILIIIIIVHIRINMIIIILIIILLLWSHKNIMKFYINRQVIKNMMMYNIKFFKSKFNTIYLKQNLN